MIWGLGYLIGIILCVVVLAFTGFDCDDVDTVWLVAVMWPLLLIVYFIVLIWDINEHFIDIFYQK